MLNRSVAPEIKPIDSLPALQVEQQQLQEGADLFILNSDLQPIIKLDVVLPAGRWYEPKHGLAHLTSKMIFEGTESKTASAIAAQIAYYGASLTCTASADRSVLSLFCLYRHFRPMAELLLDLLRHATIPAAEFDQRLKQTIQNVKIERQKNAYLASEALSIALFGKDHPYRTGLEVQQLEQLTREQVQQFYASTYTSAPTQLYIAGHVTAEHLQWLRENFGYASPPILPFPPLPTALPSHSGQVTTVKGANNLQSSVRAGRIIAPPTDPDYFYLSVLNEVLGGYFGSRLMKNLREDKGYTYGIHSSLAPCEHSTTFVIATDVIGEKATDAVAQIDAEIDKLRTQPISSEELSLVKNNMLGKLASEHATIFDQLEWVRFIHQFNLPLAYTQLLLDRISNVTSEDILTTAQNYLIDPLTIIVTD